MLPFFMMWIASLLFASFTIVLQCAKKKKNNMKSQKTSSKSSRKMSVKTNSMLSRKTGPPSRSVSRSVSHSISQGSSKKRRDNNPDSSKMHRLKILDPNSGTYSATDEHEMKSRQTGQRTREREPIDETATIELREKLLAELENTKSIPDSTATTATGATATQQSRVNPKTATTTLTTTSTGTTAISVTKSGYNPSMILEESSKPVQANKGVDVRSKTVSVVVGNQGNEKEVKTQEAEKTLDEQEDVTQSNMDLSKKRKKKSKIPKLKKLELNKKKDAKNLVSKNEKGGEK